MVEEQRIRRLEARVEVLTRRVGALEAEGEAVQMRSSAGAAERSAPRDVQRRAPSGGTVPPAPSPARPQPQASPSDAQRPQVAPPRAAKAAASGTGSSLEDLLGGRVLAWLGGAAVVLGIAFLFAVAVSRGWLDESVRTLLAGAGSAALLGLGVWLHERKARSDAALAATGAGIAGLFVTVTVAAQVYEVIPIAVALALALVTGVLATALAVRWHSQVIAVLGIVGALLSPVLAGAPLEAGTLALLFLAWASAAGVVLWRRWAWLSLIAYLVATPQWLSWLFSSPAPEAALAALCAFGALGFLGAVGYELRVPTARLRSSSGFLLALNAVVLAAAGWFALADLGHEALGKLFLAGLACAHFGVGLRRGALERISHELGLLSLTLGVLVADLAFALTVDGLALTLGFAGSGVGFAALGRLPRRPLDGLALQLGLGGHISVALLHALVVDAPPTLLAGDELSLAGAASVLTLVAACLTSARLAGEGQGALRIALDALGLGAVAYLTALSVDGAALPLAWGLESCLLAAIARHYRDRFSGLASLAFLAGGAVYALAMEAAPRALLYGLDDPLAATLAVGSTGLAAAFCARELAALDRRARSALGGAAAALFLYLASAAIVTPFQPGGAASESTLLELDVRQQGQVALSLLWSLAGLAALVVGLVRDLRAFRIGGLSVLLLAVAKVFLFDLAALGSLYRVVSFCVLGLLLLTGAFLWQRARPRPLDDLRRVPDGLR